MSKVKLQKKIHKNRHSRSPALRAILHNEPPSSARHANIIAEGPTVRRGIFCTVSLVFTSIRDPLPKPSGCLCVQMFEDEECSSENDRSQIKKSAPGSFQWRPSNFEVQRRCYPNQCVPVSNTPLHTRIVSFKLANPLLILNAAYYVPGMAGQCQFPPKQRGTHRSAGENEHVLEPVIPQVSIHLYTHWP